MDPYKFYDACLNGENKVIKEEIETGANPKNKFLPENRFNMWYGSYPLWIYYPEKTSSDKEVMEIVSLLAPDNDVFFNKYHGSNTTYLHYLARNGRFHFSISQLKSIFLFLLGRGLDANVLDDDGCSAFHFIVRHQPWFTRFFIENMKADPKITTKWNTSPFMLLTENVQPHYLDAMKYLISIGHGPSPNISIDDIRIMKLGSYWSTWWDGVDYYLGMVQILPNLKNDILLKYHSFLDKECERAALLIKRIPDPRKVTRQSLKEYWDTQVWENSSVFIQRVETAYQLSFLFEKKIFPNRIFYPGSAYSIARYMKEIVDERDYYKRDLQTIQTILFFFPELKS